MHVLIFNAVNIGPIHPEKSAAAPIAAIEEAAPFSGWIASILATLKCIKTVIPFLF